VGGVSTLSEDASTALSLGSAATSSYKPENGPTVGAFGGLHWTNYFSVQVDYLWNQNLLTLNSLAASTTGANTKLYEQTFRSRQQSAFGSALLYFRSRSSWVRPFLSVGTGVVHLTAEPRSAGTVIATASSELVAAGEQEDFRRFSPAWLGSFSGGRLE
jgi:hypothetical protein